MFQNRVLPYNLSTHSNFSCRRVHSVYHGTEPLSFLGPKVWELVPKVQSNQKVLIFLKLKLKNGYLQDVLVDYVVLSLKYRFPLSKLLFVDESKKKLSLIFSILKFHYNFTIIAYLFLFLCFIFISSMLIVLF